MLLGIVGGIVVLSGAAWWFLGDHAENTGTQAVTPPSVADAGTSGSATGAADGSAGLEAQAPAAGAPSNTVGGQDLPGGQGSPAAPDASHSTSPAGDGATGEQAPAAVTQAPAPVTGKVDPKVPLPTLIEFDPLPPVEGTSQEDLDNWTTLIKELYIDYGGATGRQRKRLKDQLNQIDPVDAVPAYLNALIGIDMAENQAINATFNLVKDWQERVGFVPHFYFNGDVTDKSVEEQNKRVAVILKQWIPWWNSKLTNPIKMEDYRADVLAKLKKRGER